MKQIIAKKLIILALSFCNVISGQENWSFQQKITLNSYSSYNGKTDGGQQIKLYIKRSNSTCFSNKYKQPLQVVYGWYKYGSDSKKPLVGFICNTVCSNFLQLYTPEDPISYTFDDNCNIPKAKEVFRQEQNWNDGRFVWQTSNGQKRNLWLEPVHTFSWVTNAQLLFYINGIELKTFSLNQLTNNDYIENIDILGEKRVDNKFYLLLRYSHQSKPGSYGQGMCGNGIEEYIAYLEVDADLKVTAFQKEQLNSCLYDIENDNILFDAKHPEHGIRKSK